MASYHHQWLYLKDDEGAYEVFNGARTAEYIAMPGLSPGCVLVSNVLDFGGCQAYGFEPPCGEIEDWEPILATDPSFDPAPWYSATIPESADVLGFFIEEWTGLDNKHNTRQVTRTARAGGGGTIGTFGSAERIMKLNVLVMGLNERALEYAFQWLSAKLANLCANCSTSSLLIRRFCPQVGEDLWNGVAELREVAVVEDLGWEAPPVENSGCFIRRVSFTLAAGDPCMYAPTAAAKNPTTNGTMLSCLNALPVAPGKATCRPACVDLPTLCRTTFTFDVPEAVGAVAPILSINNAHDAPVVPLRIICYADPHKYGILPNPCGLQALGEIYTQVIPPWTEVVWDVAARRIIYSDHASGGFQGGYRLMDAVDPPMQRFFVLPCGTNHIVVEPATTCLTKDTDNSRFTYGGYSFLWSQLHFPTVTLELQERMGCA